MMRRARERTTRARDDARRRSRARRAARTRAPDPARMCEDGGAPRSGCPPLKDVSSRIGQIVWPAVRASRGEAGLAALAPFFAEFPPGGVIVFGEGVERVDLLLARLRLRAGGDLLVAADLERGCGQQVREYASLPPAMALAACLDDDAARQAGLLTGTQAREAGIDVVFAPVADVN